MLYTFLFMNIILCNTKYIDDILIALTIYIMRLCDVKRIG